MASGHGDARLEVALGQSGARLGIALSNGRERVNGTRQFTNCSAADVESARIYRKRNYTIHDKTVCRGSMLGRERINTTVDEFIDP